MRATRLVLVAAVAVTAIVVGLPGADDPTGAQALQPTADFRFVDRERVWDSRDPGGAVAPGVEVALPPAVGRRVVDAVLFDATEPSWLYFHGCGVPVDRSRPAAAFVEAGEIEFNLAPIDPAQGCMTRFGDAAIVLDLIGVQDGQPGLDYVALPSPTTIEVTPTADIITTGRITVPVAAGSIPEGAEAVAIWVAVSAFDGMQPQLFPCGPVVGPQIVLPSVPGGSGDNLFIAPVDPSGNVCLASNGGVPELTEVRFHGYLRTGVTATPEGLPYAGWVEQEAPGFVALSPSRLFDTRDGGGSPLGAGQVRRYRFTDLPATATAAALNITVTGTTGPGYVSAYPCDAGAPPEVSNVNITGPGQTVPNFAIVSLGSTQELCFFTLTSTHLVVDLAGYFVWEAGDGYVPADPSRIADTRTGRPLEAAQQLIVVNLAGRIGITASAVALNVTATQTDGDGFLTVYPCGEAVPTASNVNYRADETRPNLVVVKVPDDQRVCVYTSARTHVVVDLAGWFDPTSTLGFFDEQPTRVLDTRAPPRLRPLASGEELGLSIDDRYVRAVAWNVTVTQTTGPGFITGYPCADGLPSTSNVNYSSANETTASFSLLRTDAAGALCLFALTQTQLLADTAGSFVVPLPFEVYYDGAPARVGPFTSRATVAPGD